MELGTAQKEDLVGNLKLALSVPSIPEITATLLNLAEFTEHSKVASVSWALTECALIYWVCSYCVGLWCDLTIGSGTILVPLL